MSDPPDTGEELVHFGKYLLDSELARGGMSRVFRARLRGPGGFEKKLVVKQILPELAQDPSFVELFVREANTLVQMSHPNLVPVYELGVIDGVYFLAMEWVEGATVAELLRDGPLPEALVVQIGAQIAEALRYAHERFQIVHRDVTPRNIIVDGAGHARLLDFGIAAPVEHTGKGELFGSPGYMAPEQMRGESLGPESDLFALGSVLYEALSGRAAFPVTRVGERLQASYRPPAALEQIEPTLQALLDRLVTTERKQRPASAAEVADALRTWLAERHPRGVDSELAERSARAHAARMPVTELPKAASAAASSGRIEVRSIAVSPALEVLLQHATERIERPSPPPPVTIEESLADDPEWHRVTRRFLRDIVVITLALVAALFYADRSSRDQTRSPESKSRGIEQAAKARIAAEEPAPTAAADDPSHTATAPELAAKPEPPAKPSEAGTGTQDAEAKRGLVTVSASPWAEVRVDARTVGTTPRRNLSLRPGKHTLTLLCPPLDREAQLVLDVHAGDSLHVVADMNQTPPKLSVR